MLSFFVVFQRVFLSQPFIEGRIVAVSFQDARHYQELIDELAKPWKIRLELLQQAFLFGRLAMLTNHGGDYVGGRGDLLHQRPQTWVSKLTSEPSRTMHSLYHVGCHLPAFFEVFVRIFVGSSSPARRPRDGNGRHVHACTSI